MLILPYIQWNKTYDWLTQSSPRCRQKEKQGQQLFLASGSYLIGSEGEGGLTPRVQSSRA